MTHERGHADVEDASKVDPMDKRSCGLRVGRSWTGTLHNSLNAVGVKPSLFSPIPCARQSQWEPGLQCCASGESEVMGYVGRGGDGKWDEDEDENVNVNMHASVYERAISDTVLLRVNKYIDPAQARE